MIQRCVRPRSHLTCANLEIFDASRLDVTSQISDPESLTMAPAIPSQVKESGSVFLSSIDACGNAV